MTEFSDKNLDRSWSPAELSQLSEKELAKLSLLRNVKNLIFFGVGAIAVSCFAARFGTVGTVIGWVAIVVCGFLALEPVIGFVTTFISILGPMPERHWKFVQLLISGVTATCYAGFAVLIYTSI